MKKEKFVRYDIDQVKESVAKALCWTDVCRGLDVTVCTFNFKRIQKLCEEHKISVQHFDVKKTFKRGKKQWSELELFTEHSKVHRTQLRRSLIRFGHYTGQCSDCGIGEEWNGKRLTLEIDHINGRSDDNRKENLRWLCPNCHSQTPTFKRSNIRDK